MGDDRPCLSRGKIDLRDVQRPESCRLTACRAARLNGGFDCGCAVARREIDLHRRVRLGGAADDRHAIVLIRDRDCGRRHRSVDGDAL